MFGFGFKSPDDPLQCGSEGNRQTFPADCSTGVPDEERKNRPGGAIFLPVR